MENELTGKYREVFEKAELYGVIKNIDSKVQDEMMMNLFDILLSAQKDGKPVEKIIGTDIEALCDRAGDWGYPFIYYGCVFSSLNF